jgi:hypothetical protein
MCFPKLKCCATPNPCTDFVVKAGCQPPMRGDTPSRADTVPRVKQSGDCPASAAFSARQPVFDHGVTVIVATVVTPSLE